MTATAAAPVLPRLEKYELLEEIGHGGMATVYRARDPRLGREVAVKVIHRHLRENVEVGTRFVAEARASAKLRHPGIVEIYDVSDEDTPERYLVVELVRGCTLRKLLVGHRDMPAEVGAAIVRELCDAVEHAHAAGIIHRDIKPENVLVELPSDRQAASGPGESEPEARSNRARRARVGTTSTDPSGSSATSDSPDSSGTSGTSGTQSSLRDAVAPSSPASPRRAKQPTSNSVRPRPADLGVVIKITDFGIAKILDAQGVTSTGQVLGSPAHMAPEQIEGGDVDPRTDVFALGVLLYECLVGHLPFEGKNPAQVLRRVLDGEFPQPDTERPAVGGRWAAIVVQALARDAADRTASAAELGRAIGEELASLGVVNGKSEILAYLTDPEGYSAAHVARLVPLLTARGEAARARGDVRGAAADWNRALALAPNDLALLKRMASLTRGANRRVLARRAAAIVGGSLALGVAAFGAGRVLRQGPPPPDDVRADATASSSAGVPVGAGPGASPSSASSTRPAADGPPRPTSDLTARGRIPVVFPTATSLATASGPRRVQFSFKPAGVTLLLDGAPQPWVGRDFQLAPGAHAIVVTPNDPNCCQRYTGSITVDPPPAGAPDAPQPIHRDLTLNPSSVSLAASAPRGATLECPEVNLVAYPGIPKQITLKDPLWSGRCTLKAPDGAARKISVRLTAGGQTVVPWD